MPELSSSSFSETDASNSAAAPNGFPEGMPFSGVNDSARAVMGAVKRFWGRIQGAYASTGSANAYVLTPATALAAYVTGERYSFRANFANTGAATLNVSALGAKAIKKMAASGKADLAAGDIQSGQPVTVEYDGTDMVLATPAANSVLPAPGTSGNLLTSDGTSWTSAASPVPAGAVMPYAGGSTPGGWLLCNGQAVSRTTYAALFAACGTIYGAGDGSTTFNVPDLRGRVAAGEDPGNATGRLAAAVSGSVSAATRGNAGGEEAHTLTTAEMPAHTHTQQGGGDGGSSGVVSGSGTSAVALNATASTGGGGGHNTVQPTLILLYIIKT